MRTLVVVIALAAISMSCASSKRAGDEIDAGIDSPLADAPLDGPKVGFGENCTDSEMCESNICLLVGTAGQCSKLCGQCPTGYGCLGVTGAVIEGQVSFVCVPTSNQLCSPCTADTECALLGMDKCVTYDDGDRYCSRDCTNVTCPSGYGCEDVLIGGSLFKQCIANSAACDCDATNPGATQPCMIPTPWNVCAGAQTCQGANGWGTCAPPSPTDDPDNAYVDSNCDGIDGDRIRGIFVSVLGADNATCGLIYTNPCATISYGIRRAALSGRPNVFVQRGTYNEVIVLANAISVWGGYDVNWQRGPYSTAGNQVRVVGRLDDTVGGDNQYLTVRAHSVSITSSIDNMILEGPPAIGAGNSSYVVHVSGSDVVLTNVQILAGNGASGGGGGPGLDASPLAPASTGGTGGAGSEQTSCDGTSHGIGGFGVDNFCNATPSSRPMDSGPGGNGGEMDTSCPFSLTATDGDPGSPATYTNGGFGTAGAGGPANSGGSACNIGGGTPGGNGQPGFVQNGPAGGGGTSGLVNAGYWTGTSGGSGGTGENGGGGGAGGGGGGCDEGTDAYGAGGGGGGAGGCAALGGGTGGSGGGGSFGVFVVSNSAVAITGCVMVRGTGGTGGTGGAGGNGQPGGGGGPGGAHQGASAAGNGGAGGHGGHGGGGGGGAGGRSIGVVSTPGSTVNDDCTFSAGTAGAGGAGGNTAGDGNDGATGAAGTVEGRRVCASGTSC